MASNPAAPILLAILDDYQNIASTHFVPLRPQFEITVFRDTLLPYNHVSTPDHVKQELVECLKPFTVISCMRERTPFPAALLEKLPNLKLLLSTGLRNASIDLEAAKRLGIRVAGASHSGLPNNSRPVTNRRGLDSTSQHAVALILGIARNLAHDDLEVKTGGWETTLATGLSGKIFGSVGLGRLGVSVARILYQSFGMRIHAWSTSLTQEAADEKAQAAGLPIEDEDGEKVFKVVSKEVLFKEADFVSVHYVLSDRSRGIVSGADLSLMKKSAYFVNTSRGPLVDEGALLDLLERGAIRGAALDVFDIEPLPKDSRWRTQKWGKEGRSQVLLSPHMGYVEDEAMSNFYAVQAENARRWQRGEELLHVLA